MWHVGGSSCGQQEQAALFVVRRSGDWPAKKFEVPGIRASGIRSPSVSTTTAPIPFAVGPAGRLHGRGLAGNVKLPVSSNFRPPLVRAGFTGMNVIFTSAARGATKFP